MFATQGLNGSPRHVNVARPSRPRSIEGEYYWDGGLVSNTPLQWVLDSRPGQDTLIQLIYRAKHYEGNAKDYEFSRRTMEEHWRSGYNDAVRTLRHPEVLQRPNGSDGVFTFDLANDGRE
jgi:predicted acylesterase/phospholipase RssA